MTTVQGALRAIVKGFSIKIAQEYLLKRVTIQSVNIQW